MTRPTIGFKPVTAEPLPTTGLPLNPSIKQARWDGKPPRAPKKGEYFISGAIPAAYRAKADMTTAYFIAALI